MEASTYIQLKRAFIGAGLLNCSQAGFNISLPPIVPLRELVEVMACQLAPSAQSWIVPTLLRKDAVPAEAWEHPAPSEWMEASPVGHWLTPRPLAHLLVRLKYHPVDLGEYMLRGWCFRHTKDTLPLLRQLTFAVCELAQVGSPATVSKSLSVNWEGLVNWMVDWDLAVKWDGFGRDTGKVSLVLKGEQPIPLASYRFMPDGLLSAYKINQSVGSVAIGIDRICLAVIARYGVNPGCWPSA